MKPSYYEASFLNSRLGSTQQCWYRLLGIPLDVCGPWNER